MSAATRPPRTSHARGLRSETIAALWLALKGYRVLARRYRAAGGEIDLIVKRGRTVVFVEVKARPLIDEARIAITPRKEARLLRAARHWLARNPWAVGMTLRCDAVFLARRALPRHLPDAVTLAIH